MGRLTRTCFVITGTLLILAGWSAHGGIQTQDPVLGRESGKNYTIQIAASKVYIDPGYFEKKFDLAGEVACLKRKGWYKYVTGFWATEPEALAKLPELKFSAFVTRLNPSDTLYGTLKIAQHTEPLPKTEMVTDTLQAMVMDKLSPPIIDLKGRQVYNQQIRAADSAFYIAGNLPEAKRLYESASVMEPDKIYPKGQITGIERKQMEKDTAPLLSGIPDKVFLIGGISIVLILTLLIALILLIRKDARARRNSENEAGTLNR